MLARRQRADGIRHRRNRSRGSGYRRIPVEFGSICSRLKPAAIHGGIEYRGHDGRIKPGAIYDRLELERYIDRLIARRLIGRIEPADCAAGGAGVGVRELPLRDAAGSHFYAI